MSCSITHITPDQFLTTAWSGGTTSQLAIAPEGAVYADRDFLWRVSSAVVGTEESTFTALPDYDRLISTLKGTIRVRHDGGAELELAPFGIHRFDGGADTRSWGTCVDFNLMLRKGRCDGSMASLQLSEGRSVCVPMAFAPGEPGHALLVYCAAGAGTLTLGDTSAQVAAGEALLLRRPEGQPRLSAADASAFMLAEVRERRG